MTEPTAEQLTAAYREFRLRLTALGRSLDPVVADTKTPTCPEWSTKDVLAHMTGIAADVLDGNVERAATEEWADAQVDKRRGVPLNEVLEEWDTKGPLFEDLLSQIAPMIAFQFYVDAFTHDWDIRQAVDAAPEAPDYSLVAHVMPVLMAEIEARLVERDLSLDLTITGLPDGPLRLSAEDRDAPQRSLTAFEFLRVSMGRRSAQQIHITLDTANLPAGDWVDAFVYWTPNEVDIVDPVVFRPVAS